MTKNDNFSTEFMDLKFSGCKDDELQAKKGSQEKCKRFRKQVIDAWAIHIVSLIVIDSLT